MQRLSSGTQSLSRDPNLADGSYFDPLTQENNGPLPENSNEKGRLWNSQSIGPENPDAGKKESGHLRAPQPKRFAARMRQVSGGALGNDDERLWWRQ
jgi:hypothetical protein